MNKAVTQLYRIHYTRFMDMALGQVFVSIAQYGASKIDEVTKELIKDAMVWKPAHLHSALREQLERQLVMEASGYDEETFLVLMAVLKAASGDYELLAAFVEEAEILDDVAHEYFFDTKKKGAADDGMDNA